jgi:hypothetical protein
MQSFSATFLIFFQQVAMGGVFALAATPFSELDRAFYKSTAGVLFVIAAFALWGESQLWWHSERSPSGAAALTELLLHGGFVLCLGAYLISLWRETPRLRARAFAGAILTGFVGLAFSGIIAFGQPALSWELLLYPIWFLSSALLLGTVTVGMLLGHWYLIDTGQTIEPFLRIYKFFVAALLLQSALLLLSLFLIHFAGTQATSEGLKILWAKHPMLLTTRVLAGQAGPLVLSWMIWRTLQIPHTMAATGLFYIALLGVFVGEILGRQILTLTGLPF